MDDPTSGLVASYQAKKDKISARYEKRRVEYQKEIDLINQNTGKQHSCLNTGCYTTVKGNTTYGSHWRGKITPIGSARLAELKKQIMELDRLEKDEIASMDEDKAAVISSSLNAYQEDLQRYTTEIQERSFTLKGYVLIAYPFSFVIEFLLASLTFMAMEYLYETKTLSRPKITTDEHGLVQGDTNIRVIYSNRQTDIQPTNSRNTDKRTTDNNRKTKKKRAYEYCQNPFCDKGVNGGPKSLEGMRIDAKYCGPACRYKSNESKKGYSVDIIKARNARSH